MNIEISARANDTILAAVGPSTDFEVECVLISACQAFASIKSECLASRRKCMCGSYKVKYEY